MSSEGSPPTWYPPLMALLSLGGMSVLAWVLMPNALGRYFSDVQGLFDANIYWKIAAEGYTEITKTQGDQGAPAFYPLWPMVMRAFWATTGTGNSIFAANLLAAGLFVAAVFVFARAMASIVPVALMTLFLLCFTLNPNSMFHLFPYSESMACLTLSGWLVAWVSFCDPQRTSTGRRKYLAAFGLVGSAALVSLSRPMVLQFALGIGLAKIAMGLRCIRDPKLHWKDFIQSSSLKAASLTMLGLIIGYSLYGMYCLSAYGSFFHPFHLQSLWGRTFGWNWGLLYAPKTVSGSVHILIFDLISFWVPLVAVVWLLIQEVWADRAIKKQDAQLDRSFLEMLCWGFCLAHGLVAFFTYERFFSLGRHVLGLPIFYAAIALRMSGRGTKVAGRLYGVAALISAGFLLNWWARYARGAWMG